MALDVLEGGIQREQDAHGDDVVRLHVAKAELLAVGVPRSWAHAADACDAALGADPVQLSERGRAAWTLAAQLRASAALAATVR